MFKPSVKSDNYFSIVCISSEAGRKYGREYTKIDGTVEENDSKRYQAIINRK